MAPLTASHSVDAAGYLFTKFLVLFKIFVSIYEGGSGELLSSPGTAIRSILVQQFLKPLSVLDPSHESSNGSVMIFRACKNLFNNSVGFKQQFR